MCHVEPGWLEDIMGNLETERDGDGQLATVLLVDDDENSRIIYSTALRHAGYRVLTACDGEEGLDVARASHPQLVLMDVAMPKLDGRSAVMVLKADPAFRNVPTVALTARASWIDETDLLKAGFDEVLLKPIAPNRVLACVKRRLRASP
jgi:CheY-like chemotaxis protein